MVRPSGPQVNIRRTRDTEGVTRLSLLLSAALLGGAAQAIRLVPIPALPPGATPAPVKPAPVTPAPVKPAPVTPTSTPIFRPPSDPLLPRQWNLNAIGMAEAWAQWQAATPKTPVTVAVLDTGYVASPELAGRVVNGYDFVRDAARAGDGNGRDADASGVGQFAYHAEAIANIIGAAHDGRGMAGIHPGVKVVHVRVAGQDGMIDVNDLVDGLKWAAGLPVPGVPANPNPARLINLSLYADFISLTRCDARVQSALDAVTARGVLVVAGAANDGADAGGYSPAGCRNVLTVTSVSEGGERPAYANWGRSVALAAPGGEPGRGVVVSSLSGQNSGMGGERAPDGTSFAAPHATGVASLLLSVRPKLTPAQIRDLLTRTATPFPFGTCDVDPLKSCGAGTLNADAALRAALSSNVGK